MYVCMYLLYKAKEPSFDYGCSGNFWSYLSLVYMRTKATMAANSYKKMYADKETFSNISIMSSRVFGARLETC